MNDFSEDEIEAILSSARIVKPSAKIYEMCDKLREQKKHEIADIIETELDKLMTQMNAMKIYEERITKLKFIAREAIDAI